MSGDPVYLSPDPEGGYVADASETDALRWLKAETGNGGGKGEHKLKDEDLLLVLRQCRVPDADGLPPTSPAWRPTWELRQAASIAWRQIAGRLATTYEATAIGGDHQPNDWRYVRARERTEYWEGRIPTAVDLA